MRDYRFQTRFYLDKNRVLYVRGGGDPFLVSEELALLAPQLVAAIGKQPINGIVLDASYYPASHPHPGHRGQQGGPIDALNSALGGELQYDQRRSQREQASSSAEKPNPDHSSWRSASSVRGARRAAVASV